MSRVEEVKENQNFFDTALKEIDNAGLEISQEQLLNLNLAAITQQLAEISTTLAIIADKLEGE